jgi:hypothetical protein
MAPPKRKPPPKKRAAAAPRKKLLDELQRSTRDPFAGPSSARQIERSLDQGTRKTLAEFRGDIDWE